MRKEIVAAFLFIFVGALPALAESGAEETIKQFFALSDRSDFDALSTLFIASPSILDDFPPHHWIGMDAYRAWSSGVSKLNLSDMKATLPSKLNVMITGADAYAVVPVQSRFKMNGQSHTMTGTGTFALDKTGSGWKIASFAWSDGKLD